MPQLSPLNWAVLFILFWSIVGIMNILIWWNSKKIFYVGCSDKKNIENKWFWK
uniref:ATP synthase F0 subunit 8 n=1 Tax=Pomacea reevei TaxID=3078831 RepID=A0AA96LYR9_9CAEN|nr:ATP synthase F0 subunit 8 [Pomacea reevei]WNR57040.1 ATP synthase F0 subunit 8 [Pomacea reevei]